jgi:FAD/FMN-containing dehydrogenase
MVCLLEFWPGGCRLSRILADFDVINNSKAVFGDNYPRLQAIKKRYDPDNVFNKWFPITA